MRKTERAMHLHDCMTYMGWIAGPEAHSLAYWTMRLADELEGVGRYVAAYRTLRQLAWENVRPFDNVQNAISSSYPDKIHAFLKRNEGRFPAKYEQSLREIRNALSALQGVSTSTGRKPMALAA
jgi:hypothetical protein